MGRVQKHPNYVNKGKVGPGTDVSRGRGPTKLKGKPHPIARGIYDGARFVYNNREAIKNGIILAGTVGTAAHQVYKHYFKKPPGKIETDGQAQPPGRAP